MLYMGATDVKHRGNYVKKIGAKAVRANEVLPPNPYPNTTPTTTYSSVALLSPSLLAVLNYHG